MALSYDFFYENVKQMTDPSMDPEKYNFYHGLCSLSQEVESLRSEVRDLALRYNAIINAQASQ